MSVREGTIEELMNIWTKGNRGIVRRIVWFGF